MTHGPRPGAGLRRAAACALATLLLAHAAPGAAQVRAVKLTLDNDAYNFWVPPATRPDREYTNGMDASLEIAGGPLWARRLAPRAVPCNGAESADSACAATTFEIGQKIFTPRAPGPPPAAGQRPYAGWLYFAATGQVSTRRARRAMGIEVGVTGPPSLGEAVHETWHRIAGFSDPQGWDQQLRFEPGLTVRYDEARLLGELRAGGGRVLALAPEWGAEVGNVRTAAHVGARAAAGFRAPHPWSAAADRDSGPLAVYAVAAARQEAVAHNLFLDGNTFAESPRVERRPFVFRYEVGGGVRWRGVSLEYRTATRTREYETEPEGHTYSTFELTFRPRR
ncbi:MAG TPA: lipid A deacylase LpxR family protein [Longimicrobium sp.]|nr:lipid A deacylase LpxR family protein [Longimicrobium sp.]